MDKPPAELLELALKGNATAAAALWRAIDSGKAPDAVALVWVRNCYNARSEPCSAWHGLFANRWLLATVMFFAGLQVAVVHLAFVNQAFGTATNRHWMSRVPD